jgi:hypothetical protein
MPRTDKRAVVFSEARVEVEIVVFIICSIAVTPDGSSGFLCLAGLLTRGSKLLSAFPVPKDQWPMESRSPHTVAGAVEFRAL